MPEYRKTKTVGVYVRHQARCPAGSDESVRCRCQPSYRGRRWDTHRGGMIWSDTFRSRSEVLTWLGAQVKGADAVAERAAAGPLFSTLADEWLEGVRSGAVGRRKGRSWDRLFPDDAGRVRAVAAVRAGAGVRRAAGRRDRRSRMADVGGSPQPRRSVAVADRQPPGRRASHLRLGGPPHPPPGRTKSPVRHRATAERREAADARG